jgi:aspartyl-tRNA(Asn)/glutamyl-tRNA(Gln) amidotransferase subunit C
MKLTIDEVKHIAKLSRLELTEEELNRYSSQLSSVLEYIKQLDEVDTSTVQPTINTTGMENRMREDKSAESLSQKEALSNTKDQHNGYFVVPNVFE